MSYQELEPFYDQFEKVAGTSGTAGNINGQIQPGGNPFEGPRTSAYPTPPIPCPMRRISTRSGEIARLFSVPDSFGQCVAGLYEHARRDDGAVQLLRFLRLLRLRQLFEVERADLRGSGSDAEEDVRSPDELQGHEDQSRQHRQEGHRRHLCR